MRCCPRVVSRIFCLAWCIFCSLGVVGIFGEEMLSFGAVRVSRERNSLYQGMFIFFSYLIYQGTTPRDNANTVPYKLFAAFATCSKVSPRRDEGIPPYRTFYCLLLIAKYSVENGLDRSSVL